MSRNRWICVLTCFAVVAAAVLTGCAPAVQSSQYYMLTAARQIEQVETATGAVLDVRRLGIDAAFASRNLVYRLGEFEYEVDPYREFLIPPEVMITEKAREWLADSGLFHRVLPSGSRMEPTHTLEGTISALYGDFAGPGAPVAVTEIRFFLVQRGKPNDSVVLAETYMATNAAAARTAEALLEALDRNLVDILTRLEADLQEALAAKTE